ncbi:MAG: O-antigen ligase family protein [Bacillota bacterium]
MGQTLLGYGITPSELFIIFFGAFALPFLGSGWVPAVLGWALVFSSFRPRARVWSGLWAVAAGWSMAWLWRFDRAHLADLVGLALIGPALALVGLNRPGRSLRAGIPAGGAALGFAVLAEVFSGRPGSLASSAGWPWGRGAGTLGNPNVAGAYLAAVLPFALTITRRPWARWPLTGIILAALIATGSRGGWMAAFAAVLWFLRRRRSPYLSLFLAVVFLAVLLPSPVGSRLWAGIFLRDSTAKARLVIWQRAMRLFLARPVAGWGMAAPLGWAAHPHNLFLEILLAGGLWAAVGFLPLGFRLARLLFGREDPPADVVPGASLIALLTFGLVDAVLTTPVLAVLFWLDVGMVLRKE